MRRPRALLDLQAAPIDLQAIELAALLLGRHEQLPRAMLDVDDPDSGCHHRCGQYQHAGQLQGWSIHGADSSDVRAATRMRALRARGLRSTSIAVGRTSLPRTLRRGRACSGTFGKPAYASSPRASRAMKRLTMRSSSE